MEETESDDQKRVKVYEEEYFDKEAHDDLEKKKQQQLTRRKSPVTLGAETWDTEKMENEAVEIQLEHLLG